MALNDTELLDFLNKNVKQYSYETLAQNSGRSEADIRAFLTANQNNPAYKPLESDQFLGELGDPHAIQQAKTAQEIAQRRLTDPSYTPATGPTLTRTAAPVSNMPNPYATTRAYEPELFQTEKPTSQPSPKVGKWVFQRS